MAQQPINIGAYSVFTEETTSSNDALKLLLNAENLPEGALLYTHFQTKGRGMMSNVWESEPAKNLLLSVYLNPQFLRIEEQVWLNVMVSLAIHQTAATLTKQTVHIKWPNDIYIQEQKVAGILVENVLQGNRIRISILGIGLNLNQVTFSTPKAASLAQFLGSNIDPEEARKELCQNLSHYYALLKAKQHNLLWDLYHTHLLGKGQMALFKKDAQTFEGMIMGIDKKGKLHVMVEDEVKSFVHKEIEFIKLLTN